MRRRLGTGRDRVGISLRCILRVSWFGVIKRTSLHLSDLVWAEGVCFACAILFWYGNILVRGVMMHGKHGGQHQPAKGILPGPGNTDWSPDSIHVEQRQMETLS